MRRGSSTAIRHRALCGPVAVHSRPARSAAPAPRPRPVQRPPGRAWWMHAPGVAWQDPPPQSRTRRALHALGRVLRALVFAAIGLAAVAAEPALGFEITATSPLRLGRGVSPSIAEITVTFDAPVALPPASAFRVAGSMSGLHGGVVETAGNTLRLRNWSRAFLAGETVTVNLRSDVHGTAGGALSGGRTWTFTIASRANLPDWSAVSTYGTASIPYYIHGGDLDNDGTPDLAVPNEGTHDVSVFRNTLGAGVFSAHAEYGVNFRPSSVFGEDFDNDGDQDLATADINGNTMSVLTNNGHGVFPLVQSYAAGSETRQVSGGDFDGDNDIDLCTTSRGTNQVFLFTNGGASTFTSAALNTVARGPFAIRCADLNGDWHLDIAVGCQTADSLTVLLNDGAGGFVRSGTYLVGDGPWDLHANDLDGDGDCDLVCVCSFANRLVVLRNDGAGKFPVRVPLATGVFPLAAFTADLDGDGDFDALSSNYNSGSVSLFRNDGAGNFTPWTTLFTLVAGSYTWASDLDGDRDLDLSVVDEESDLLFVFLNGGTAADAGIPGPGRTGEIRLRAAPNPMMAGGTTRIALIGATPSAAARARVFDLAGRAVRTLVAGGSLDWVWDGSNAAGRPVAAGRYYVVVRSGNRQMVAPVHVVR